jgi:hypothetical protein
MYVKYKLATGFTWQQFMTDLKNIILGNATTLAELVAVDAANSEIAGTGPTAGTYSFVSESYNANAALGGYFQIKKKHAQWEASTFEAEMNIRVGSNTVNKYFWMFTSDINEANAHQYLWANWSTYSTTLSTYNAVHNIGSDGTQEIHMIINDSTLAISARGADTADIPQLAYTLMHHSDFRKTTYDNYLIAGNSAYYPGAWVYQMVYNGWQNNYTGGGIEDNYNYGIWRWQYGQTKGGYRNPVSFTYPTQNKTDNFYQRVNTGIVANASTAPTLLPRPGLRIFEVIDPATGTLVPPRIPLVYDAMGWRSHNNGVLASGASQDMSLYSEFLDVYRTSDGVGWTGEIVTDNSVNYRIFRGQKTGGQAYTSGSTAYPGREFNGGYHTSCFLFPEDNVVI